MMTEPLQNKQTKIRLENFQGGSCNTVSAFLPFPNWALSVKLYAWSYYVTLLNQIAVHS